MKINKILATDKYFLEHAKLVSSKSKCLSRQVGSILVKDDRIISTGYNGTPINYKDCIIGGCPRCKSNKVSGENLDKCFCVHSEINTIIFAARYGLNISDSILYTTSSPCLECAKAIINARINKVVYIEEYSDVALKLLKDCKVKTIQIKGGKKR